MKVLITQDDLFGYLQHIVRSYAAAGIDPEEGLALFQLNQAIKSVQTVDETQIAKIVAGEVEGIPLASVKVGQVSEPTRESLDRV